MPRLSYQLGHLDRPLFHKRFKKILSKYTAEIQQMPSRGGARSDRGALAQAAVLLHGARQGLARENLHEDAQVVHGIFRTGIPVSHIPVYTGT